MAIDIRAVVNCSLGELISGDISDSYIQGAGLIKTRGSCELTGIHTPAIGSTVTFSYTRNSTTTSIPRRLRVLSSFADPFRNTTRVELGCILTYMEGVGPTPTVDGESSAETGRRQQCLNGYTDYPANAQVPYPISASLLMATCLTNIGITASSNPLTNRFFIDEFDFSAGYVTVLGDLLLSESYFGYIDENEVLQVRELSVEGGGGPVFDSSNIIDLSPIGVGDLPGDAVVVRYDSLKLEKEQDVTDSTELAKRNWEEEEILGTPETHVVRHTDSNGNNVENSYTYIPYQKTVITYGEDESWDPNTCILASGHSQGYDLSDSPVLSETTERVLRAEAAPNYLGQVATAGVTVSPGDTFEFVSKRTEYKYDDKGELVETIVYVYEPFIKWAGGLDVQFVYNATTGTEVVTLGTEQVLVEKTITRNENIYARSTVIYLKPGEEIVPVVDAQKVTTERYINWALTPQGQQSIAQIKDETPFASATECQNWLLANSTALVLADGQVQINRGRDIVQGQKRASSNARVGDAAGTRPSTTARLAYASGSSGAARTISLSMPYQSDDYYTSTGTIIRGDAGAKALRYGRAQNRLLLGNRYGVNLQIHADDMPAHPYDPLYISDGSLMVQYRSNGANWAFSSDGIVASLDALFWGIAGGSGTSWVPVAPGITSFPALPTVTNGQATVDTVVPPWNETVPMEGVVRTISEFTDYEYVLNLGTTALGTATTSTTMTIIPVIGHDDMIAPTFTELGVAESGGPSSGGMSIQSGDQAPVLGDAYLSSQSSFNDEWTVVVFDPTLNTWYDDEYFEIDVQGWLTIDNTNHTTGYFTTNGFFSWPTGSTTYTPDAGDPALNKLIVSGGDLVAGTIAYSLGNNYLRFRIELWGYNSSASVVDVSYEVTFFKPGVNGEQLIEVRYGDVNFAGIQNLVDLMICDTTTAYDQVTPSQNSSYVLEGNATGTSWTIHENSYVDNPDALFQHQLGPAVVRTSVTYPVNSYLLTQTAYTGDGQTDRSFDIGQMYPALVWTNYNNRVGTWTAGPGKAYITYGSFGTIASQNAETFKNYSYGGYTIGNNSAVNSSGKTFWNVIFGADGPPVIDNNWEVPITKQTAPGMMFLSFTGTGSGYSSGGSDITIPNYLGGDPELIIYDRYTGTGDAYAGGSIVGTTSNFLNISGGGGTAAVNTTTSGAYFKAWNSSEITLGYTLNRTELLHVMAFRSSSGVVDIGTFTDNGTNAISVTGVGFQPRWILLRCRSGTSDWIIFSDNYTGSGTLKMNVAPPGTNQTLSNNGSISYDTDGFTFTPTSTGSGRTWIYMALA